MKNNTLSWDELCKLKAGTKVTVVETLASTFLPKGYESKVVVCSDGFSVDDAVSSFEFFDEDALEGYAFILTENNPIKKVTLTQRKAAAKKVREAEKVLLLAIEEAEDLGLDVSYDDLDLEITYQPPLEGY